jgi:hypothetical protein
MAWLLAGKPRPICNPEKSQICLLQNAGHWDCQVASSWRTAAKLFHAPGCQQCLREKSVPHTAVRRTRQTGRGARKPPGDTLKWFSCRQNPNRFEA